MNESLHDRALRLVQALPVADHLELLAFMTGSDPETVLSALAGFWAWKQARARHMAEQARAGEAEQDAAVTNGDTRAHVMSSPPGSYNPFTEAAQAEDLLVHYFKTVWTQAGLTWDGDNETEVRLIVDGLMGAAENITAAGVSAHHECAPHLYSDGSTS